MSPRKFGNEGDGGARIERDLEDVGLAIGQTHRSDAGARGQRGDAHRAEIGAEDARARQAEERRDQQPVDLRVGIVAQGEQRPVRVGAALAGEHLDAADDAVFAGRRGLSWILPAVPGTNIDGGDQVDGVDVLGGGDDLEGGDSGAIPASATKNSAARARM